MTARAKNVLRALAGVGASLPSALALAQETTGDRSTAFQAGAHQDIPGGTLLVAAYAIVLVLLVAYVVYLAMLQQSATKELGRLEEILERKRAASDEKKD